MCNFNLDLITNFSYIIRLIGVFMPYFTNLGLIIIFISYEYLLRITINSLLNTGLQSNIMTWLEQFQNNKRELLFILTLQDNDNRRTHNRFRHHLGTNYPLGFRLDNRPDLLVTLQYIVRQSGNQVFFIDNRGKVRSRPNNSVSFPSALIPLVIIPKLILN